MLSFRHATIALFGFALAVPVHAAASDTETTIVHVARPVSSSPDALRQLKRRIGVAALEACGASAFSAPGVKDAVARSSCWRQSYADGIAQVGGLASADAVAMQRPRFKEQP